MPKPKQYLVKRITDGAFADLRYADRGGLLMTWSANRSEAFVTGVRARAQKIAAILEINAYPHFGKIIIEEAQ